MAILSPRLVRLIFSSSMTPATRTAVLSVELRQVAGWKRWRTGSLLLVTVQRMTGDVKSEGFLFPAEFFPLIPCHVVRNAGEVEGPDAASWSRREDRELIGS